MYVPAFGQHAPGLKSKETRNSSYSNMTYWHVYMIKGCLPKVGIKLVKMSYVRILFLVSLLFVAVVNPYSVFKILIFKYSSTT